MERRTGEGGRQECREGGARAKPGNKLGHYQITGLYSFE